MQSFKADHVSAVDEATGLEILLFHPRRDSWEEHFRVDRDSGKIVGLTPVAIATIVRLQMNRPRQLAARQQWARLGLFP